MSKSAAAQDFYDGIGVPKDSGKPVQEVLTRERDRHNEPNGSLTGIYERFAAPRNTEGLKPPVEAK